MEPSDRIPVAERGDCYSWEFGNLNLSSAELDFPPTTRYLACGACETWHTLETFSSTEARKGFNVRRCLWVGPLEFLSKQKRGFPQRPSRQCCIEFKPKLGHVRLGVLSGGVLNRGWWSSYKLMDGELARRLGQSRAPGGLLLERVPLLIRPEQLSDSSLMNRFRSVILTAEGYLSKSQLISSPFDVVGWRQEVREAAELLELLQCAYELLDEINLDQQSDAAGQQVGHAREVVMGAWTALSDKDEARTQPSSVHDVLIELLKVRDEVRDAAPRPKPKRKGCGCVPSNCLGLRRGCGALCLSPSPACLLAAART